MNSKNLNQLILSWAVLGFINEVKIKKYVKYHQMSMKDFFFKLDNESIFYLEKQGEREYKVKLKSESENKFFIPEGFLDEAEN